MGLFGVDVYVADIVNNGFVGFVGRESRRVGRRDVVVVVEGGFFVNLISIKFYRFCSFSFFLSYFFWYVFWFLVGFGL